MAWERESARLASLQTACTSRLPCPTGSSYERYAVQNITPQEFYVILCGQKLTVVLSHVTKRSQLQYWNSSLPPPNKHTHTCLNLSVSLITQVETLRVVQLYACLDRIDRLEWASNSLYILCGLYSRAIVQVCALRNENIILKPLLLGLKRSILELAKFANM